MSPWVAMAIIAGACCNPPQPAPRLVVIARVICRADAVAQPIIVRLATPIAVAVAPGAVLPVGTAVALDNALVHPAIQAACARVGQPVAVIVGT